jgi:hypothetical protein
VGQLIGRSPYRLHCKRRNRITCIVRECSRDPILRAAALAGYSTEFLDNRQRFLAIPRRRLT